MNKKFYLLSLLLLIFPWGLVGQDTLTLPDAIQKALHYKPSFRAHQLKAQRSTLSLQEAKALWWPEIALSYDYRFNPVVATTVIPIGQFDINNPTDVVRGIKMGTKWQQNGGLTLSQPFIDFSIARKLKGKKWEEKRASAELLMKRDELIYEVAQCYLTICQLEAKIQTAIQDTLRTYAILQQQKSIFQNQRLLHSDLNHARINYNLSLNEFQNNLTQWTSERIYLAFLTGISAERLIQQTPLQPIDWPQWMNLYLKQSPQPDSLPMLRKLEYDRLIALSNLRLEKAKSLPTLHLEAFIGGNQYADCLDPFKKRTWYASSYIGLSFKLPILYGENWSIRNKSLRLEITEVVLEQKEQKEQYATQARRAWEEVTGIQLELQRLEENQQLSQEAMHIVQRRFEEKQQSAFDLNLEELELLKNQQRVQEKKLELIRASLDYLQNAGLISTLLQK